MKKIFHVSIFLAIIFINTTSLWANTWTVDSNKDITDTLPGDGFCDTDNVPDNTPCTLRAAIMEANAHVQVKDEIIIPADNYALSLSGAGEDIGRTGDLDIVDPIILTGAGAGLTIINANQLDRGLHFHTRAHGSEIYGITVTSGSTSENGAGIYADVDSLSIEESEIIDNKLVQADNAALPANGAGLYFVGIDILLENVTIEGNVITASTVSNNEDIKGAGAYIEFDSTLSGKLVVNNVSASSNQVYESSNDRTLVYGGGLFVANATSGSVASLAIDANIVDSPNIVVGAGFYLSNSSGLSFDSVLIRNNSVPSASDLYGAGFASDYTSNNKYSYFEVSGNKAAISGLNQGGAWFAYRENDVHYKNFIFSNNEVTTKNTIVGGAIFRINTFDCFLTNIEFTGQVSASEDSMYGGVLASYSSSGDQWSSIRVQDSSIKASGFLEGSVLKFDNSYQVTLDGIEVSDNLASLDGLTLQGGLLFHAMDDSHISNVDFKNNVASVSQLTTYSVGINVDDTTDSSFDNINVSNNKTTSGTFIRTESSSNVSWNNVLVGNNIQTDLASNCKMVMFDGSETNALSNWLIHNNALNCDRTGYALSVDLSPSTQIDKINIVSNNTAGLYVNRSEGSSLTNSLIRENDLVVGNNILDTGAIIVADSDSFVIEKSQISHNTTSFNYQNSAVYDGHGAGVSVSNTNLKIVDSQVSDNTLAVECIGRGAGITASSTIEYTPFELNIVNSSVVRNKIKIENLNESQCSSQVAIGAGIYANLVLTIDQSTIAANDIEYIDVPVQNIQNATSGAGIYFAGNCQTGALGEEDCFSEIPGKVEMYNATVVGNKIYTTTNAKYGISTPAGYAGGILISSRTTAKNFAQNTLIANNSAKFGNDCGGGNWFSYGFNLISDMDDCALQTLATDQTGSTTLGTRINPLLENLGSYGGLTETIALKSTSPAIDGGDPTGCNDSSGTRFTYDQRGTSYSRTMDGNLDGIFTCDIGAYEYQLTDYSEHGR